MDKKVNSRGIEYTEKDMVIARKDARLSVFMQAMARLARMSPDLQEFAQDTIKKADEAHKNAHPDDLYGPLKLN